MNLVVDIGNARIKWALACGGELGARGSVLHLQRVDEAFAELAAVWPGDDVERVLVANVAGRSFAERIGALVRARYGVEPAFLAVERVTLGVRCGYDEPARLGVDRWAAVIAAHRAFAGAVCVVGAGTAVTFDAVDADGRHLGGLIFAGPRLAAGALERNTHGIGATAPAGEPPRGLGLLGTSTDTAVGHAALLGVAAGIDRAVATVRDALDAAPAVLVTGGDAALLADWVETPARVRADLVLEGLALLVDNPRGP